MIGVPLLFAATLAFAGRGAEMTMEDAVRAAREALSRAGVAGEEPRVVGATPVTWPDARLGCEGPAPSSPAKVPGYRVNLQVGGQVYRVHVAGEGAVICGPPLGVASVGPAPEGDSETGPVVEASDSDVATLVGQAKQDLEVLASVPAAEIELVKFREVIWPDSSLGCPKPGLLYTQVLSPGYRIALRARGRRYEYHGARGGKPFLCAKSPVTS